MDEHARKMALYEQFARVGRALANPARLAPGRTASHRRRQHMTPPPGNSWSPTEGDHAHARLLPGLRDRLPGLPAERSST